jgi:carbon-monoxide dehydrogenase medium subunit
MMGGTDLFPRLRERLIRPDVVVDVKRVPGMRDLAYDDATGLTLGAALTMNEIVESPQVASRYPLLAEAAGSVASYQLRNRATIGGNLCNASPCADTAPATIALDGMVQIYGPSGEREVAAEAFFRGPGKTDLQAGEFLTGIRFPPPPEGGVGRYLKLGRSKKGDLALVSVAVFSFPDSTTPSGYSFRIVLGAVAPTPLRAPAAEEVLSTQPPGEETFARAAQRAMEAAVPIDDVRSSAAYRREMVRVLTLRGLLFSKQMHISRKG